MWVCIHYLCGGSPSSVNPLSTMSRVACLRCACLGGRGGGRVEEKDFLPPLFQREGVCLMRGRQGEEGEGERGEGGDPTLFN